MSLLQDMSIADMSCPSKAPSTQQPSHRAICTQAFYVVSFQALLTRGCWVLRIWGAASQLHTTSADYVTGWPSHGQEGTCAPRLPVGLLVGCVL